MTVSQELGQVRKLKTGIPGFDAVADGGLPRGRTTLVAGSAGSGKTIFSAQFLASGITTAGEAGVFVTFEESPTDIRRNLAGFGWHTQAWESAGQWAFVDASPDVGAETIFAGEYDLGALLARIEHAVERTGARRVAIDSLGAIYSHFTDSAVVRSELFRIVAALRSMGVTAVLTAERAEEYGPIARYGIEEFVADNVIILRNVLDTDKRHRSIEILKFRGTTHQSGEHPFVIASDEGIRVIPLSTLSLQQPSSNVRITSGSAELDEMCGGGFFRDSIVLVSGATGTGKTLLTAEFIGGGAERGERCLLLAFEESREQLFRNAGGWGIDLAQMERDGLLRVICVYPEASGLAEHLARVKTAIDEFQPQRVAVDSLSALERIGTDRRFREFTVGLTAFIKEQEIAGMLTATTTMMGGTSATEAHISTITDAIILLRYVEVYGDLRRGITVLKMRGSWHDKRVREFIIDEQGMHIGRPFRAVTGILSGQAVEITTAEVGRIEGVARDEKQAAGG